MVSTLVRLQVAGGPAGGGGAEGGAWYGCCGGAPLPGCATCPGAAAAKAPPPFEAPCCGEAGTNMPCRSQACPLLAGWHTAHCLSSGMA